MTSVPLGATITMTLWASCYPIITLSIPYAPVMLTAFFRAILAGLSLVLIAFILKRPLPRKMKHWTFIVGVGLTATSVGFWGMFYASDLISPGLATVINSTQPLIAGVLGWFILKEHMDRLAIFGTFLGFLGISIISVQSLFFWERQLISGITYIIAAATGIAISNILLKKMAAEIDILYAMGFQLLIGSIPLGIFALNRQAPLAIDWHYVWIVISLALPGTAVPFVIWYWLMDKAPLYRLNIYSFLTPMIGLALGRIFFTEVLSLNQWIGIIMIIAAIKLVSMNKKSFQKSSIE
tara:strand:+ start:1703 stop:2587 length:885 start_codon:yes stop_codon:yes gene_type:complete